MRLLEHPELQNSLARLTCGMLDYMESADANYSAEDVEACRSILIAHAEALEPTQDRSAAMDLVRITVERLNKLNEEAGEDLIESDQREEICEFMIKAGTIKGFNSESEDVTEAWRQW
jgi:hypothetical protein